MRKIVVLVVVLFVSMLVVLGIAVALASSTGTTATSNDVPEPGSSSGTKDGARTPEPGSSSGTKDGARTPEGTPFGTVDDFGHSIIIPAALPRSDVLTTTTTTTTPSPPMFNVVMCKGKTRQKNSTQQDPERIKDDFLEGHNHYRRLHKVGPLVWDDALAKTAQDVADTCNFEHTALPHGESLARGPKNVASAVDFWYDGHKEWYIYAVDKDGLVRRPVRSGPAGHFTQLVWKGTSRLGCAVNPNCEVNGKKQPLYVCQYEQPGNWAFNGTNHYAQNVFCQNSTPESNPVDPNYVHPTLPRSSSPPPPAASTGGSCGYEGSRPVNGNNNIDLSDQEAINRQFLSDHNHYRRLHGAPELQRSAQLEASAKIVADKCIFAHDPSISYGENLAAGFSGPTAVMNAYYDEHKWYDRNDPKYSPETGHFTQLVWNGTRQLGCAAANCPNGVKDEHGNDRPYKNLYACHYSPRGNIHGRYGANVNCKK
jgi:uncharacterized protein YkwD